MDSILQSMGQEGMAADQQNQRPKVSPRRKYPKGFLKTGQIKTFAPGQAQMHNVQKNKIDQNIKMGNQGFPETDWAPTENEADRGELESHAQYQKMDMDLFQDLQSELGVMSEISPFNRRQSHLTKQRNSDFKKDQQSPMTRNVEPHNQQAPRFKTKDPTMHSQKGGKEIRDDITNGITIESLLDPNHVEDDNSQYKLTLRIKFETNLGESLAVVGDIKELGCWKEFAAMQWTEGHVWVLKDLPINSKSYFSYKYVLMKDGKPEVWEQGENRLADLRKLNSQDTQILDDFDFFGGKQHAAQNIDNPTKQVEILDKWENFEIKFSIHTEVTSAQDYIMISGPANELGGDHNPMKLTRAHYKRPKGWLDGKYGKDVRPFEISIPFKNGVNSLEQLPTTIKYRYIKMSKNQQIRERIKHRELKIEKPENYRGIAKTDGTVWIINGVVDQVEGNFLGDKFRFFRVNDYNLYFGSYLVNDKDLYKIKQSGIKHVINLQTDDEIRNLKINLKELSDQYTNHNIRLFRTPLKDVQEDEYAYELQRIAQQIHSIVDQQKQSVLVHCSSGQSRSPTVVMAYLCLYKQLQYQNNLNGCLQQMKHISQEISPNVRAVEIAIQNQDGEVKKRISSNGSGDPVIFAEKPQSPIRKQDPGHVEDQLSAMTSIERMIEEDKKMRPRKTQGINLNLAGQQNLLQYETSSAREDQSSAFNYRPMRSNRKAKKDQDFDVGSQITSAPWEKEGDSDTSKLEESFAKPQEVKQVKLEPIVQSKQSIFEYQESIKQQKLRDQELQQKQQKIREYEDQKAKALAAELAEKEHQKQVELLEQQKQERMREEALKIQEEVERVQKQAQEEIKLHEQRQQELLEKQKQEQREFEEQLRREMEKKLAIQQYEAEKLLQQKEETARLEKEQALLEQEEKRILKERKRKQKEDQAAQKAKQEELEKQKIQEEMDRKMKELAELQNKLEQEQKNRQKIEEEKAIREQEIQAALEAERLKAQREREEAQRIIQEKQQKESEEIERLKKIQEALISASKHKRQLKEEKKKKRAETLAQIQIERDIEEMESKRLAEERQRKLEEAKKDQKPTPIIVQPAPVQTQEIKTPENANIDKYLMASNISCSEMNSEIPIASKPMVQPQKQDVIAPMIFTESEMPTPIVVDKPVVGHNKMDETVTMSPARKDLGYNTQEQINAMTKKAEEKRQARFQQVSHVEQSPKSSHVVVEEVQKRKSSKPPKPQPIVTKSAPAMPKDQQKKLQSPVESPALNPNNVIDETLDQTLIMYGSTYGGIEKETEKQTAALHKQIDQYILETESHKRLEDQKALILQKSKEAQEAQQKLEELKQKEQQLLQEKRAQEQAANQQLTEKQKLAEELEKKQREALESLTKEQIQRKNAEELRLKELQEKEEEIEKLKLQLEREKRQKTEIEKRKAYEDELRMRKEVETQLQLEQEKRMRETIAQTLKAQLEQERLKREQENLQRQQRELEEQELQKENLKLQEERELRIKQERERIDQNLRAAREAEESAKRLKQEIESLEKQRQAQKDLEAFEMAQASVAGSMIINLVEKEIAAIFKEEQDKAKREESDREERLRQIQLEKDKIAEIQKKQLEAEQVFSAMSSKNSSKPEELKQAPQDKKLDQLNDSFQISDYVEAHSKDQTINDLLDQNVQSPPLKLKPESVEHRRGNSATILNFQEPQEDMGVEIQVAQTPMREKIAPKAFKVAQPVKRPPPVKKPQPKRMDQLVFNSMDEQDHYFEHLFDEPPLPFKPRKNNTNDEQVNQILIDYGYTIPVVHIKDKLYLIGNNRVTCDFKFNQVLVKGGGGSQKLEDYIAKNEEQMQNNLIEGMAKSGRDIGYVVEQFKEGKKIHKTISQMSSVVSMSQISQMSMANTVKGPPSKRGNESPRKPPTNMNATSNSGIRVYEGSVNSSVSPTRQPKGMMTKDKIGRVPSRKSPQKF